MIHKRRIKRISVFLLLTITNELITPNVALALTSGPSQPEVQSFTPLGTTDMVSMFSGDFNYNIPLLDLDGYPVNLSYSSGITMDQEASWVGLGWNINPGVINRNMRGVPDDFNGDEISKEFNIKPNQTYGANFPVSGELLGIDLSKLGLSLGLNFNNYRGMGVDMNLSPTLASTSGAKGSMTLNMGISLSSESGLGLNPSLSFGTVIKGNEDQALGLGGKVGLSFNSRAGLGAFSFSASMNAVNNPPPKDRGEVKEDRKVDADGNKEAAVSQETSLPAGPSFSGGSSISFGSQTYTPSISMPMTTTALSLSFTGGGEIFGFHPLIRLSGYYSGQSLTTNYKSLPAFGYMNAQNGQRLDNAMLDFNREKDGSYSENTPALPITNFTYDVFSVSGQGIGGVYRPFRGDWSYVNDPRVVSVSQDIPLPGIEIGAGAGAHPGLNISVNGSVSTSGKWADYNPVSDLLTFKGQRGHSSAIINATSGSLYEPYYFKQAGEKTAENDLEFLHKMGNFDPVRLEIVPAFFQMPSIERLRNEAAGTSIPITDQNFRKQRVRRNEVISVLSAGEASVIGLNKSIESYTENEFAIASSGPYKDRFVPAIEPRVSTQKKSHHISEITTYRSDGTRYVYGIPAYNFTQQDVTFAISGRQADYINGLVGYTPDKDNTIGNTNGVDNYFERVTKPPFAHSYLLTSVLGANYVDLTDDGPTADDLGSYTKINYSRVALYKWRTPYDKEMASHNEGFKSQRIEDEYNDDKASYIYGTKENWYMHSMESKNYIALFHTSDRADGCGVDDHNGGGSESAARMKKLDKIELYSRQDLITNGEGAVPIKTVHFVYAEENSLCQNIRNHINTITDAEGDRGKLTLTQVYFTYGKSQKGKVSPYVFEYGQVVTPDHSDPPLTFNPDYNMKGNDRWGNYKQTQGDVYTDCNLSASLPLNGEFPYTDQDKFNLPDCPFNDLYKADVYAHAWTLTTIGLPSGGEIKVTYEADDYAYVQNRRAMQMMRVAGVSTGIPGATADIKDELYDKSSWPIVYHRNYIVFDITDLEPGTIDNSYVEKKYFSEFNGTRMPYLYLKFLVNLRTLKGVQKQEFVPGYIKISTEYGAIGTTTFDGKKWAYVKVDAAASGGYNPIALTAWNFARMNLPRVAYNQPDRNEHGVLQICRAIESMGQELVKTIQGFENTMVDNNCGNNFNPNKSFIRIYSPHNFKKGGGARVKKIRSIDKWATLTDNADDADLDYGQEYDYTTKNEYGDIISSGVAAYEPSIGGEENPFKMPVFYTEEKLLAPDDQFYQEEPYGESFFPGPSVGYSKVTVRSLKRGSDYKSHGTGKVVHEFYTAKDFPTIPRQTSLYPVRMKPDLIFRMLSFVVEDYVTVSQGFSVELNDMHGKQKAQWVYAEQEKEVGESIIKVEAPISGVEYKYQQVEGGSGLDNDFTVIGKDGKLSKSLVGVEVDQVGDFREQKTVSESAGFGGNLDAFLAAILPVAIPIVLPSFSSEIVRFRSSVITKVINRYGILTETITYDAGAKSSSKNLAVDQETGEVILTEATNTFGDHSYHFTYPAHWVYDHMGQAYRNIGYYLKRTDAVPISINNDPNIIEGDELLVNSSLSGLFKGWVSTIGGVKHIVDNHGNDIPLSSILYLKVERSGRKNQQSTVVGSLSMLANPIQWNTATSGTLDLNNRILDASAVEYSDDWKIFCECELEEGAGFNKILRKRGGAWRPKTNWLYLTHRQQSFKNGNTNVRTDGTYETFNEFWVYNNGSGKWAKTTNDKRWQFKSSTTIFSPYGMELESVDPLDRSSAAIYGYGNMLPTAVSGNAKYREIGFDSFEDYDHMRCFEDHFSYKQQVKAASISEIITVTSAVSHSGKNSLKVKPNESTTLTKTIAVECE